MWKSICVEDIFFLIFFFLFFFSQEAIRFGTLVLFAFGDRGCFLLCSGSFCLCSEDPISLFTWRREYIKLPNMLGSFPFHQKDPKHPSNLNLNLISQALFLHPLSWERCLGRAVFWCLSVLKYCFRNIHWILPPTTLPTTTTLAPACVLKDTRR